MDLDFLRLPEEFVDELLKKKNILGLEQAYLYQKVNKLIEVYGEEALEAASNNYIYAGIGSEEIYELSKESGKKIRSVEILEAVRRLLGDDDLKAAKAGYLQPKVDTSPEINKVREFQNNKVLLQYVVKTGPKIIRSGYELSVVDQTTQVNCVFDSRRSLFHVRGNSKQARMVVEQLGTLLEQDKISMTKLLLDNNTVKKVKRRFDADTHQYTGKNRNSESPIERKILRRSRSADQDLVTYQEFKKETRGYALESDLFSFDFDGKTYYLEIGIRRSSLYFRNHATESLIDEIVDTIYA